MSVVITRHITPSSSECRKRKEGREEGERTGQVGTLFENFDRGQNLKKTGTDGWH